MITLAWTWRCLACDEHGDGDGSDKAAEKHTKATTHATATSGRPA